MKKLILSFTVLAAMAAASCSTSETKAQNEGAAIKAKIENCTNPDSLAIYVKQAKDYADKLVSEGNDKAAQAYLDEVAPVVQSKDPTAASVFDRLKADADSAVTAAGDAVKATADSAAAKVSDAKDKVVDAASNAKDKAVQAASDAKDKASKAASDAKDKAADAISSGADKIKEAVGK